MNEIEKYIAELGKEIAKVQESTEKEEQLLRLQQIAKSYAGEDRLIPSSEIEERIKNRPDEYKMLSGYAGLDRILGGFRKKQLVVVSAATKSGKTSFCIELTSMMKLEAPTWIPFEEGAEELIQKFLDRGEKPPLFFTPATITGNTLQWVEKKIIEAKAKFDSKIMFIDHLHFIVPFAAERQDLAIGQAMRELKRMAKQWDMVVVIIAHLKKTKVTEQPTLEDLRDSSFIAQEADTVLMLYRESKREAGQVITTDNVNISVSANRRTGKTGNVKMVYRNGHFFEQDWKHAEEDKDDWGGL